MTERMIIEPLLRVEEFTERMFMEHFVQWVEGLTELMFMEHFVW